MSKDIVIGPFNYAEMKLSQNFDRTIFGKKGGGLVALQFFGHF